MSTRSSSEATVFCEALACPTPEGRAAYLKQACRGDADLRNRVEALLRAREENVDFLASPAAILADQPSDTLPAASAERDAVDQRIGPYKLLERIGKGGFGSVYLAEQREPVRRSVALKIIKLGMDTRQVIARFEAERQALAMMDHPNIARVLDAGATETGRPYFVMELVKGVPITEYCDEHRVALPERLALFADVCHAVQHAHQKGIIHRDLKPTNVLVSRHDDRPVVKVIDFGIAKATGVQLTDKTLHTEWRQLIGTPTYMSPEQAGLSDMDIDTRSDIYALGGLLYELLTGTTPFEPERVRSADFDELRRIIREVEAPKPSTRVSSLVAAAVPAGRSEPLTPVTGSSQISNLKSEISDSSSAAVAGLRNTDPRSLTRTLRGDLDWIVMKCLEKDRTRRYETASVLAADVQRYLADEPVLAGPPSRLYRFRKFARRNRGTVTAASLVALSLLGGIAGTTFGLLRAEQRRIDAEKAQGREREQRELAEKREKETQQVSEFQAAMLREIDVEGMGRGIKERFREQVRAALVREYVGEFPDLRTRTPEEIEARLAAFDEFTNAVHAPDVARGVMDEFVLARAAEELERKFADQPLVQAQLHDAIGRVYRPLGLYQAAEPHLCAALEIRQRELGEEHAAVASSMFELGVLRLDQGDLAAAEPLFRQSLALYRRLHGECKHVASALGKVAAALYHKDIVEAERLARESLALHRKLLGNEHRDVAVAMARLGHALEQRQDYAAAQELNTESLAILRKAHGNEHPAVATALSNLGTLLWERGDYAGAEPLCREALAITRRVQGDEHPDTATSLNNLATVLLDKGDYVAAEPLFHEALAIYRKRLGDGHPELAGCLGNLVALLQRKGEWAAAEPLLDEVLMMFQRLSMGDDLGVAYGLDAIANGFRHVNRPAEALPAYEAALAMRRRIHGRDDPGVARNLGDLGYVLMRELDRPAEALPKYEAKLEINQRLGDEWGVAWTSNEIAYCLYVLDRPAEALPKQETAQAIWKRLTPDGDANIASSLAPLGMLLLKQGRYAEAEPPLRECLAIREREIRPDSTDYWRVASTRNMLGGALAGRGAALIESDPSAAIAKFTEAEPLLIESGTWLTQNADGIPEKLRAERLRQALERIVTLYESWDTVAPDSGKADHAAEWRAELEKLAGP